VIESDSMYCTVRTKCPHCKEVFVLKTDEVITQNESLYFLLNVYKHIEEKHKARNYIEV